MDDVHRAEEGILRVDGEVTVLPTVVGVQLGDTYWGQYILIRQVFCFIIV